MFPTSQDVAARGLDVKGVTLVINYDPPKNAEEPNNFVGIRKPGGVFSIIFSLQNPKLLLFLPPTETPGRIMCIALDVPVELEWRVPG